MVPAPSLTALASTDAYFENKYKPFVEGMPKVELHAHIGGSVDPKLAWRLIYEQEGEVVFKGMKFDSPEDLESFVHASVPQLKKKYSFLSDMDGLSVFLWKYNATRAVFAHLENIPVLIDDIARQYKEENTMHLELRTALKGLDLASGSDVHPPYTAEAELEAYTSAIKGAREKYGMSISLILCMRRGENSTNMKLAERTVALAKEFRREGVVGIDLAGAEHGNEARPFARFFRDAKLAGLKTTIHGGEAYGDGSVEQIVEHELADRVGHGVAVRPGSKAFKLAWVNRIPFEVCVTSNIDCGAFRTDPLTGIETQITDPSMHPVKDMMIRGIQVTINCDNRQVSNTSLTEEFQVLNRALGLNRRQVVGLTDNAIQAAFLEKDERIDLVEKLWAYADEFKVRP